MIIIRVALLGLLGCVGVMFGMETDSYEFSKIIVNPIVQRDFLPEKKAISFTIGSYEGKYFLGINDSIKSKQEIMNLLCIVKKQLDAIKLVNNDILKISYTDISLSQEMDNKSFTKDNFFIQYTTAKGNSWFNNLIIAKNYCIQVFKDMSNVEHLASLWITNDNNDIIKKINVQDVLFYQLASHMLENSLMYYISSDQKNIIEILKCWIELDKPRIKDSDEFNNIVHAYDVGYENCVLYIDAEYDCTVMSGNRSYTIQSIDFEKLQQIRKRVKQFVFAVKNFTNNQTIKMNITTLREGSTLCQLQASATPSEVLNVTLVNKDNPQKYTTWQKVHYFLNNYSGLIAGGGFLLSVLLLILINPR